MIYEKVPTIRSGPLTAFVFPSCGHAAPDVPLLLVQIQYLPDLQVQAVVVLLQSAGQVLVDGGFGYSEVFCCGPDRGPGFNHVHSQFAGTLLHAVIHLVPSDAVCYRKPYAKFGSDMHS